MANWRTDPAWSLVEYDPQAFATPPPKPTATAELAQPPARCSDYQDGRLIATWYRTLPTPERVVAEMARQADRRRGIVTNRDTRKLGD